MNFKKLRRRIQYWRNQDQRGALLREEMQFHLDLKVEEFKESGMTEDEARHAANIEFGNVTRKAEDSRSTWIARWATDFAQDLAFAARTFRKQPGFTIVASLSAALGIGACSTIFGLVNFALFRPLPVEQPSRLLSISGSRKSVPNGGISITYPELMDIRQSRSYSGIAAYFPALAGSIESNGEPRRNWGALVTANYFEVVRPRFVLGRGFNPAIDDKPGAPPMVVLSHQIWQTRFGSDPNIAGRIIRINKLPVTVTGVTEAGFRGTDVALISDFWVPLSMMNDFAFLKVLDKPLESRNGHWLLALGRLRDGVTKQDALAETNVISRRLSRDYPKTNGDWSFHVETAGQISPAFRNTLVVFFGILLVITTLVLLTACANIANLLLARASARQKEIATRLAIGAGRGRLIRQLLAESILLGLLGGVGGLFIAQLGAEGIGNFHLPLSLPIDFSVTLDYRVVLFCAFLSIATGMIFGLVPSLRASRSDLAATLREATGAAGAKRFSLRNILVVTQVAVCMLLLICSGLFLRSLYSSQTMDLGFKNRDILLLSFDPALNRYDDAQSRQLMRSILDHAQSMPGVESASLTDCLPLSLGGNDEDFEFQSGAEKKTIDGNVYRVSPGFFETLGLKLVAGQNFTGAKDTVILNKTAAGRAFPGQDPIGRTLSLNKQPLRVVGVTADSKSRTIGEDPQPVMYLPLLESYGKGGNLFGVTLMLRTRSDPATFATTAQRMMRATDPALAVFDVTTFDTHLNNALILPRLAAIMFGICGGMGLLISIVGLYGVVSFAVARRRKEIGIRMALGAHRSTVLTMILRQGLTLTAIGCAIGIALSFAFSSVARTLLYGIRPQDPLTFLLTPLFLIVVALVACLVPARRAAGLEPTITLRYE